MTAPRTPHRAPSGISLVETIVSVGVLAIVAPLALAAMMRAGGTGFAARAETRAPAMIEACLDEIGLARIAASGHLDPIAPGQPFGGGTPLCLAFDRAGRLIGKVDGDAYDQGAPSVGGADATYLASLRGEEVTAPDARPPLLRLTIGIEHPAAAPRRKRTRIEFLTQLP